MAVLAFLTLFSLSLGLVLLSRQVCPQLTCVLDAVAIAIGTLYLAKLIAPILAWCLPTQRMPLLNKAVFITGCDSGFGHETAKYLDSRGFHVFAGCLKPEEDGAKDLKNMCSNKLHIVPLDVTSDSSIKYALDYVKKHLRKKDFWGLVSNAGVAHIGELEWTTIDQFKSVFEVNTFGAVRVTQAFLPLLRKCQGRIVIVTSIAVQILYPGIGVYTMSKWATSAFCEMLRLEMKRWGVKVITIEPFPYKTAMANKENVLRIINSSWEKAPSDVKADYGEDYVENIKETMGLNADHSVNPNIQDVAECIYDAISEIEPENCYRPAYTYQKLIWLLIRLLPKSVPSLLSTWAMNGQIPIMLKSLGRKRQNITT